MKKSILIIIFLLFFNSNTYCQVGIIGAPMVVTDVALTAEAGYSAVNYALLESLAAEIPDPATNYRTTYNHRVKYLFGFVMTSKINRTLDDVEARIDDLEVANNNLISVLNYSKKRKNIELIDDVREEFTILKAQMTKDYGELDTDLVINFKMDIPVSIYGEQLNLYYNMRKTITRINRILDIIEDNIGSSVDHEKHIGGMKNTTTTTITP